MNRNIILLSGITLLTCAALPVQAQKFESLPTFQTIAEVTNTTPVEEVESDPGNTTEVSPEAEAAPDTPPQQSATPDIPPQELQGQPQPSPPRTVCRTTDRPTQAPGRIPITSCSGPFQR